MFKKCLLFIITVIFSVSLLGCDNVQKTDIVDNSPNKTSSVIDDNNTNDISSPILDMYSIERIVPEVKSNKIVFSESMGLFEYKNSKYPKYGYIDEIGKVVLEPIYDYATGFKDGIAVVAQNIWMKAGEPMYIGDEYGYLDWSLIDKNGNVQLEFPNIEFPNVVFIERRTSPKGDYLKVTTPLDEYTDWGGGIKTQHLERTNISMSGETLPADFFDNENVSPEVIEDSQDMKSFEKFGRWGYKDYLDNVIIEPQYDMARNFSYGYAVVKKDENWMLIDEKNNILISSLVQGDLFTSKIFDNHIMLVTWRDTSNLIDYEMLFDLNGGFTYNAMANCEIYYSGGNVFTVEGSKDEECLMFKLMN